ESNLILENDTLKVTISKENGSILGIYDKRFSKQYIGVEKFAKLFRLMIPIEEWYGRHIDSEEQLVQKIEKTDDRTLRLHFGPFQVENNIFSISAIVLIRILGENIELTLKVENRENTVITNVLFPYIGGLQEISDRESDAIYLPSQLERRITNPLATLAQNHYSWSKARLKRFYRYPFWLSSTWIDYSNIKFGLAFDVRSKDFRMQDFYIEGQVDKDTARIENNVQALSFAWSFHPHITINEEWESPKVIIRAHEGNWHIVADDHRQWVESWIPKAKISEQFVKSLGWHFYFMKHQDGTVINTYDDLPKMAKSTLDAGIPYILLFGWQQLGHDNYYPFGYNVNKDWGGVNKLHQKLNEVKNMGCNIIPFSNFTLMDTGTEEYKKFAKDWAVESLSGGKLFAGNWARDDFAVPIRQAAWRWGTSRSMLCVEMCFYDNSLPWILETADKIYNKYGFGHLQLDQIGHKFYNCYNSLHNHEKPQKAFQTGVKVVLKNIKNNLRKANPEGVLIGEGFTELTAAYCDAHWTWNQLDFPEPLLYSIPWTPYSSEIDALEYAEVNKCFVYKIMLDLKIDGGDGNVNDYPAFTRHLKKLSELKKNLDGNIYVNAYFKDEQFIDYTNKENGIIAKVFQHPVDNKIGIVIVNTTDTNNNCTIKLLEEIEINNDFEFKLYKLDGSVESLEPNSELDLELVKYDVNVIGITIRNNK
ncbi:DUF6259 domain-containing protein, partial [Bacteroidota bacterium]